MYNFSKSLFISNGPECRNTHLSNEIKCSHSFAWSICGVGLLGPCPLKDIKEIEVLQLMGAFGQSNYRLQFFFQIYDLMSIYRWNSHVVSSLSENEAKECAKS